MREAAARLAICSRSINRSGRRKRRAAALSIALLLLLCSLSTPRIARAQGWLSGWGKRVKWTIDRNDIKSDLSNFPVLVYLSTTSGRGPDDVSFIFDELQSNDNRKKIAATKSDGTTQCYVEIERWDQTNKKAWLWVKVPSISGAVDTALYLYYDRSHADNTDYVGDTDSVPAQNVWDSGHVGVWHLGEAARGAGATKDSTQNNNDGTDYNNPPTATGKIGYAMDFNGTNQYVDCGNTPSLNITGSALTISAWIAPDFTQTRTNNAHLVDKRGSDNLDSYRLHWVGEGGATYDWRFKITTTPGGISNCDTTGVTWNVDEWHYVVGTYNGSYMEIYWDGVFENGEPKSGSITMTTYPLYIAAQGGEPDINPFDGTIDEVRISNIGRGSAWVKASYESERDHLIDFETEQTHGSSSFSAFVDGGSVAIGTSETTLSRLNTSFSAGNNLVIAFVQLRSTASTTVDILKLTRAGTVLRYNAYLVKMGNAAPSNQKWFALMAFDSGAPASASYDVRATGAATGISGEAKIIAISGLTGANVTGSSTDIDDASNTTLATLSTSLPAGDNIVIAILESSNYDTNDGRTILGCYLNRGGVLAKAEYSMHHDGSNYPDSWNVLVIPYLDAGAPANAQYTVTAYASWNRPSSHIDGRATLVAFSKGSLSAAYRDGGSTYIGGSETTINALNTSFVAGREVVVIASEQFDGSVAGTSSIAAADNRLQEGDATTGQTLNEFQMEIPINAEKDDSKGFGLLNRFTSIPASPTYKVKARVGANNPYGEAKVLAITNGPEWQSYSSQQRTTVSNLFNAGDTVYMMAKNLASGTYKVNYYDGSGNLVNTWDNQVHSGGHFNNSQVLTGDVGTWHCRLYNKTGTETLIADDTFTVQSAVPEFPMGILTLPLPITAIYLYVRRRSERGLPTSSSRSPNIRSIGDDGIAW